MRRNHLSPFRIVFTLCAAAAALSAQEAQPPQMTARELFYNAGSAPAAKPTATPAKSPAKIVAKKQPAQPAAQQATSMPPAQAAAPQTAQTAAASTPDGNAKIITVAETTRTTAPPPATGTALGLKYTLLKLTGGAMMPAAPSSIFHAYDKIQFSIETNSPGYLYIVSQGSSGTWRPIFPSPEIEGGSNRVEGFHTYIFPSGYRYVFDQLAGEEKVFLIFSRDPKPDFEQLVYSLQGDAAKPASKKSATPASAPQPAAQPEHILRASIDDSAVGRLHQTYTRDLIIEKVGDEAHPSADNASQEKAVYVVNPTGSPDSALVADINMVHQ